MKPKFLTPFIIVVSSFSMHSNVWADLAGDNVLAQRFRPYYKFSVEPDKGSETCRPCSWSFFVENSDNLGHRFKGIIVVKPPELGKDPTRILSFPDSDIRTAKEFACPYQLNPNEKAFAGESWNAVTNSGAGLYAQVESVNEDLKVITYWTLFGYNKTTVKGDHTGDITAVTVVYNRKTDALARVSFGMHGLVLESFDLTAKPTEIGHGTLKGTDEKEKPIELNSTFIRLGPAAVYQNCLKPKNKLANIPFIQVYKPSAPLLFFLPDPQTRKPEHLAVFIEWGSHEPWPNPAGSFVAAPQHNGAGVSFLPERVRFLGSLKTPEPLEMPFLYFNGLWGNDPTALAYHSSCFYLEGRNANRFHIPPANFVDRDPFSEGLIWPPE